METPIIYGSTKGSSLRRILIQSIEELGERENIYIGEWVAVRGFHDSGNECK